MIIRVLIAGFASLVCGLGFVAGLTRLMSGLLLGFGALSSFFLGILFWLPVDSERRLFPVSQSAPYWPYMLIGLVLAGLIVVLFAYRAHPRPKEQVSGKHFKFLFWGLSGYLLSLFVPSVLWFPSDESRLNMDAATLAWGALSGTLLYLVGVSVASYLLYRATRGGNEAQPELMRRFVLGIFAFFQLDKVPLLVTYLLLDAPESQVVFASIGALALCSYFPVAALLLRAAWDSRDDE